MLGLSRRLLLGAVSVLVLGISGVNAQVAHPGSNPELSDAEQIMFYERTIYERRGLGDVNYYKSLTHSNYTGWPPMMPRPIKPDAIPTRRDGARTSRLLGEKIDLYPMEVVFAGNMAMAYFVGHRTQRGGTKEPADEYFDNIHVWVKENDGLWYLM